jgi:hypothetical protein
MTAAPDPRTPDAARGEVTYAVENGWLCEVVNEHTCGTGPDGYCGAHEPGCGLVPVARVDELLREQAEAHRLRAARADHQPDAPTREGVSEDTTAALAKVLAEHDCETPRGYAWVVCDCGEEFHEEYQARAHVASALAAVVERIVAAHETVAWDAGAEAGFDSHAPDDLTDVQSRNPYRGAR